MDLRRLELLLAVVDHGGFTAAGNAIHVAQPSISVAVRELERELGAELLVRSRHGVTLTAAGEALVGPARQAIRDVATAAAAVSAVTGLVGGHLDLASLPTLAADPLARIVGAFRRAHGAVSVHLVAPTDPIDLAASVRSGAAEVGVTETGTVNKGLDETVLGRQEIVAVSPPGTGIETEHIGILQLSELPLVLTSAGTSIRALVDVAFDEIGLQPNIAVETEQRDALIPLVLAGAGTTFLPAGVAATAAAQGAVVRPTRPGLGRTVVLVRRPGPISPAAGRFIEFSAGLDPARPSRPAQS